MCKTCSNHLAELRIIECIHGSVAPEVKYDSTRVVLGAGPILATQRTLNNLVSAIDLDPGNGDSLLGRGTAHLNQQEFEAAVRDLSRAIALRPGDAAAHLNRGIALTCQERYEEAVGYVDRAIVIDPEDAESYFQRGTARIELGRYTEAIEDLDQAARLDPTHPFAESDRQVATELAGGSGAV